MRPPRPDELEALRSIEREARRAFAAIGMAEIAADPPPSVAELVGPADQGPELAALVERESATIPGNAARVAMRRPVSASAPRRRPRDG